MARKEFQRKRVSEKKIGNRSRNGTYGKEICGDGSAGPRFLEQGAVRLEEPDNAGTASGVLGPVRRGYRRESRRRLELCRYRVQRWNGDRGQALGLSSARKRRQAGFLLVLIKKRGDLNIWIRFRYRAFFLSK